MTSLERMSCCDRKPERQVRKLHTVAARNNRDHVAQSL